ncbi:putative pectinesterase/pectinesterase inhibitor 45 [Corylus avellana]|uniref:putative pectinesterase/pectinesterase inhibitor 45 n=1 Tax=Corylus avellana TaxID=13451 RepID=UPI00286C85C3|nr:putative pectinesterase/pectinesterase inhibitor 45 [Corylus avellana]
MAFQDFEYISERRRAEKQRKLKKRIAMGTVSAFALVALIAVAIFVGVSKSSDTDTKSAQPHQQATNEDSHRHSNKVIKMICNSTDYKEMCENTLSKAVQAKPELGNTRDLLKTAISATADEVNMAMNKSMGFRFNTPAEKAAFEDCQVLMQDAKDELGFSVFLVGNSDVGKLPSETPDLNNWLSAVMSYQQTCIDGFPQGKLKDGMENALKAVKELTSNSLAIVSEVAWFLSTFQETAGPSRRLLEKESNSPNSLDKDGYPTWMAREDRRMLKANDEKPTPNVIVAKDGSGDYKTISGAFASVPEKYQGRYVIYVKEGIYEETVTVTNKMVNVTLYGDGSQKSIITGSKNFVDGVRTFETATFVALGEGFLAKGMGFRNTAGPEKGQAVAARVQADGAVFVNCRFEGYQDTLYAQTHRQFYRSCVVAGTIDFIFGDAAAVFQNCLIVVRKPLENQKNVVTAQGRVDKRETTGIVLHNCRILPDEKLVPLKSKIKSYLGRPCKEYSRTVVMESTIDDVIHPDGWLPWEGNFALNTLYYAEFNNNGPGATVVSRVNWPGRKVIDKQEALNYTVGPFLHAEDWINATDVQVHFGLYTS